MRNLMHIEEFYPQPLRSRKGYRILVKLNLRWNYIWWNAKYPVRLPRDLKYSATYRDSIDAQNFLTPEWKSEVEGRGM